MATIYSKTADGQHEIETRARRLSPRARSALILVDGKRDDDELRKLIQQADETLLALLESGLIEVSSSTSPVAAQAQEQVPAASPSAPVVKNIESLRRDAVRAINDLLGPEADTLALRLERATNADQLREAVERAVAYIGNARGSGAAAQFADRFLRLLSG